VCIRSCPFDYIKVYDGPDNEAQEIDTYCGSISENRTIYSTGPSLNIVFETKSGRAEATKKTYITYDENRTTEVERRGFRAVFDIDDNYVNLGIIILAFICTLFFIHPIYYSLIASILLLYRSTADKEVM